MQTQQGPPYEVNVENSYTNVVIRPQLTEAEWTDIEKAGDDILGKINGAKPQGLLVDLSPLEYMGSSMVAMIVRCWKAVHPQKQRFVVVTDSKVVREVLDLSGLAKMWTIVPTVDEGRKLLGVSSASGGGADSGGKWALVVGVVGLVVALIGLVVWFVQPGQRQLATGLIYGGAGVGFLLGLVGMTIAEGNRRFIGMALVLVCAGLGVFRLVQSSPAGVAAPAANEAAAEPGVAGTVDAPQGVGTADSPEAAAGNADTEKEPKKEDR